MNLLGMAEVAELLGVPKQNIANWRNRRPDFPEPIANLKAGPVWNSEAILAWAEAEGMEVRLTIDQATAQNKAKAAHVVALMNMKGGVGKSTLTANLGWYGAVRKDLRVLLVDLDPQFNLSQYVLGVDKFEQLINEKRPTIDDFFKPPVPGKKHVELSELIHVVNRWEDGSCLHLIPAKLELAWNVRHMLDRSHILRDGINEIKENYDVILIDCSPTESILTWAAYYASDYILVPVKPEFLSTIGLPLLVQSLDEFKRAHKNESYPDVLGIVFNDASGKPEHEKSRIFVKQTAAGLGIPVFEHELSHSDSYPAGARRGQPIFWTDNARDTKKFELSSVANEFYRRIGL